MTTQSSPALVITPITCQCKELLDFTSIFYDLKILHMLSGTVRSANYNKLDTDCTPHACTSLPCANTHARTPADIVLWL